MSGDTPVGPPESDPAVPEPAGESWDRFSRVAVILGVLTTLIAAIVGWRQSEAATNAGQASSRAHALIIEASQVAERSQQLQQVALNLFEEGREQAAIARSAEQERIYGGGSGSASLAAEERRWRELAALTDRRLERIGGERVSRSSPTLGDISPGGAYAPARDTYFPGGLQVRGEREATRLLALRDAANELSGEWGKRGGRYVAILAVLGMALYLFGFSLSPHVQEVRGYFLGTAVLLLVLAGGWGVINMSVPVREPSDEAADEYARGHALRLIGGPLELDRAISHFDQAIDMRPTFATAYAERQAAVWARGSPQQATFLSHTSSAALADAIEDLEKARYLGADTSAFAGDLGFAKLLLGLKRGDTGLIEEGLGHTRKALGEAPPDPLLRANEAATLLALGRVGEARAAYRRAVQDSLYRDGKPREWTFQASWLSGLLTDLELVKAYREPAPGVVANLKELIVGYVVRGRWRQPRGKATLRGVTVRADTGYLRYSVADYEGFDPSSDPVSAQWYRRMPLGWAHLEGVSDVTGTYLSSSGSEYYHLVPRLRLAFSCPSRARYRVELYVDGHLAGQAEGTSAPLEPMKPFLDRDSHVAGCRPKDWRHRTVPGGMSGYVEPGGDRGMYVMRLADVMPGNRYQKDERALDATIERFARVFPARPARAEGPAYDSNFLGLPDLYEPDEAVRETIRIYEYRGGRVVAASRRNRERHLTIGLVYGPDVRPDTPNQIFQSLTEWW